MIHYLSTARVLLDYFKLIDTDAKIIGSLGKGAKISVHDIDIQLPNTKFDYWVLAQIYNIIGSRSYVNTDWGGVYFANTDWGDIDIFFGEVDFDY